jgi:hypothetical protein
MISAFNPQNIHACQMTTVDGSVITTKLSEGSFIWNDVPGLPNVFHQWLTFFHLLTPSLL